MLHWARMRAPWLLVAILGASCAPSIQPRPGSKVHFAWSGAVTASSATVVAKADGKTIRLQVAGRVLDSSTRQGDVCRFSIAGLESDRDYSYVVEVDGAVDEPSRGQFRTFPAGPGNFTIAFGSCARTRSDHDVFRTILQHRPLFFLHMGDMHYLNIRQNDPLEFRIALETVLASPSQAALYRNIPIAYMWDDHDYGPNNSDRTSRTREAASRVYREYVPHYPLPAGEGPLPIYQSFMAGRVRFIMTDLRSESDEKERFAMSPEQWRWFQDEVRKPAGLVVWMSTYPWISDEDTGWGDFLPQRRVIAEFFRREKIKNLCILSGDAHMLAIDDGTHSDGIPVFQAAALDQNGSVKGGPYTHGPLPGGGRFGLMTVTDDGGDTIHVQWSGRNHRDQELLAHRFSVRVYK